MLQIFTALLPCILSMLIGAFITGLLVRFCGISTYIAYQIGYLCGFIGLLIALWDHITWF